MLRTKGGGMEIKMKDRVLERFFKYVKIDTEADENSTTFPSSEKQKVLGRLLCQELREMGVKDADFDETFGYVYAKIPANDGGLNPNTIAFIAHMDTAPAFTGKNVNPQIPHLLPCNNQLNCMTNVP